MEIKKITCSCEDHSGKLLLNLSLPSSPQKCFRLLFKEDKFTLKFHETVGNSGYEALNWEMDEKNSEKRTCFFTKPLTHPMAPKTTLVTENQSILKKEDGHVVVLTVAQSAGVPFSDNFTVNCTYCFTSIENNKTKLLVYGEVVYVKPVWGLLKGIMDKSAYQGLEEHFKALETFMNEEVEKLAELKSLPVEVAQEAAYFLQPPQIKLDIPDYTPYLKLICGLLFAILLVLMFKMPHTSEETASGSGTCSGTNENMNWLKNLKKEDISEKLNLWIEQIEVLVTEFKSSRK